MNLLELAKELAERNRRCGHTENNGICLLAQNHKQQHAFEPIGRVIPFE